jgi:hypothetical protein
MLVGLLTIAFAAFFLVSAFLVPALGLPGWFYAMLAANVAVVMAGVPVVLQNGE